MENIKTLDDFIRSDYFMAYEESYFSNLVCSPWNKDILDRIEKAAENGSDGRTHGEILDLWQDAINDCYLDDMVNWDIKEGIIDEICECVLWHQKNGSLHNQLG